MTKLKVLAFISKWLFVLCLPPLLLSASIAVAFNSLWLYKYSLQKYNASQVIGLADSELEKGARGLIPYFNSVEEPINIVVEKDGQPFDLFNEREIIHLKDVKGLVWLDYKILSITLVFVLAYGGLHFFRPIRQAQGKLRPKYWRKLAGDVLIGSGITLGVMLAFGLFALFDFDRLLLAFHLLSFSNDFWQLSAGDNLLLFFPGFEATLFATLGTAGLAVILAILSGGHLLFNKK